jgi:hypothetical protein
MSGEKVFVDCYLFDADDFFARHEFDDFINQQKRITMRQDFLNGARIENGHKERSVKMRKSLKAGRIASAGFSSC